MGSQARLHAIALGEELAQGKSIGEFFCRMGKLLVELPAGVRSGLERGVYEMYFWRQRIARIELNGQNQRS